MTLKPGDRVRFDKRFLDRLGFNAPVMKINAADRGTVVDADEDSDGCIRVKWDGMDFAFLCHPVSIVRLPG